MAQIRPSIMSELRYRQYQPLEISALSGKIIINYNNIIFSINKIFLGHKSSDARMDIIYTTISDKVKLEMSMSIYQYACPRVVLSECHLDIIWNQCHRLRRVYNGYARQVKSNNFIKCNIFLG